MKVKFTRQTLLMTVVLVMNCFMVSTVFGQVAADPNHDFYISASAWETAGLVPNLPPLKPYPLPLVRSILEQVIENGNERQVEIASAYYDEFFGRIVHFGIDFQDTGVLSDVNGDYSLLTFNNQYTPGVVATGNLELPYYLAASFEVIPFVTNTKFGNEINSMYDTPDYDYADDALVVGPFNQFTTYNSTASAGTENIWIQAGLSRSSWGAFSNSVVLGSQAPHTANVTFTVNRPKWNYQLSMFVLAATDMNGEGSNPSKFMTMHSIEFCPWTWLDFTIYENSVYGPRFDIAYLMPIAPFMAMQQITGFQSDNLQIGMQFEVKPVSRFVWATNVFMDDMGFNDLVKLHLDTKIKVAGQTGIKYASPDSIFSILNINYALIAPYMYSHSQYEYVISDDGATKKDVFKGGKNVNYQNYTSNGVNLGSVLPPNSDCITFNAVLKPNSKLQIIFNSLFARHANVNESLPDEYAIQYLKAPAQNVLTDGSVFDFPDASNGYFEYANHKFMFMEQPTKSYLWQFGADASYRFMFGRFGSLSLGLGWTFEYIKNSGVENPIYYGGTLAAGAASDVASAAVESAKKTWKAKLHDEINNYFTVKIRYVY